METSSTIMDTNNSLGPKEFLRKAAIREDYRVLADPIFFKRQRGEATKEEWLAKIAEIKAKHP